MADIQCTLTKDSILDNLTKGLGYEKRARDLCTALIPLVSREEDKAALRKIVSDEERHIKITERLMEIVRTDYQGEHK